MQARPSPRPAFSSRVPSPTLRPWSCSVGSGDLSRTVHGGETGKPGFPCISRGSSYIYIYTDTAPSPS